MNLIKASEAVIGSEHAVHEFTVHATLKTGDMVSAILSPSGDLMLYRKADHTLHSAYQSDRVKEYVVVVDTTPPVVTIKAPMWIRHLALAVVKSDVVPAVVTQPDAVPVIVPPVVTPEPVAAAAK